MDTADLISRIEDKKAEASVALAGACLTDEMIDVLANALAHKSVSQIAMLFKEILPPQERRFGIALPYMTVGKLKDFPLATKGLVLALSAALEAQSSYFIEAFARSLQDFHAWPYPNRQIGSRAFLENQKAVTPSWLQQRADAVGDATLWIALGLYPSDIGSGFTGAREYKGTIPSHAGPGQHETAEAVGGNPLDSLGGADITGAVK